MKASPARSAARATTRRYASLVMVMIVFAVLIVIGLLMASHVHTTGGGTSGVAGTLRGFTLFLSTG